LWKLSVQSYREQKLWLETMQLTPELAAIANWFIATAKETAHLPIERAIDMITGYDQATDFAWPPYRQFVAPHDHGHSSTDYLNHLNALQAIRDVIRSHTAVETLEAWLEIIDLYTSTDTPIMTRRVHRSQDNGVNLMTSHKSKGLEFDTVYIIDA